MKDDDMLTKELRVPLWLVRLESRLGLHLWRRQLALWAGLFLAGFALGYLLHL